MGDSFNNLVNKLESWLDSFILMLPNILIATGIMVLSVFVARWLKKLFLKVMTRFSDNTAVNKLMSNIITVVVFAAGLFIALGVLELDKTVTSLLAGAGVVGLAVGLAFQDPILNIISGVMMSVREPFRIGDMVETNGFFGHITKITLRSTTIKEFTGEDVIIPNKMVIQNPIENYSLTEHRRVDIDCGVSYDTDLELAEEVAIRAIKENVEHDNERDIELIYNEFADSSINFTIRYWLKGEAQKDYLFSKSKAIKAIKKEFDKEEINIPFPIRTLEISQKDKIKSMISDLMS